MYFTNVAYILGRQLRMEARYILGTFNLTTLEEKFSSQLLWSITKRALSQKLCK